MGLDENRIRYVHEDACGEDDLTDPNERGLRTCLVCCGIFDSYGLGVWVTDNRFDEDYEQRLEDEEAEQTRFNIFRGVVSD